MKPSIQIFLLLILSLLKTSCSESEPKADQNEIEMDAPNSFGAIYFEFNSTDIEGDALERLDSIADYLLSHPDCAYQATGFAHPEEEDSLNDLALDRVGSVYDYLESEYNIPRPKLHNVTVIGPSLGQDPEDFQPPPEQEFRKVEIEFTDCK